MFVECLIVLAVMCFVNYLQHRKKWMNRLKCFPGPAGYPLIGNLHHLIGLSPTNIIKKEFLAELYESPAGTMFAHIPAVFIYDPVNFQLVASKALDKPWGYSPMKTVLGEGIITANGSKWKQKRRILEPAFNTKLLSTHFLNVFNEANEKLVQELKEKTTGEEFNLWPYILKYMNKIFCKAAMNYDIGNEVEEEAVITKYTSALHQALAIGIERIINPWLYRDECFYIYSKIFKRADKPSNEIHHFPIQILKKTKKEMKQNYLNMGSNSVHSEGKNEKKTFLELLLSSEGSKYMEDKELADEIITFMIAGTETTAVATSFTLLMLAMHPRIQEQVYIELCTVFGTNYRPATPTDLSQLPLLERCINETLRRFPPVPLIGREVSHDIGLTDGRILPAGVTVILAIYLLHKNKNIFENPNKWDPDRFLPEEIEKRHPNSFVPFVTGPRTCLGTKYAMLEIKAQLSAILLSYKLTTNMKMDDIAISFDSILRSANGFNIRLQERYTE